MLLQERVEELDSLILNIKGNKIKLTGFMSENSLLAYYDYNIKCHLSQGLYDNEHPDLAYLKDNALCIYKKMILKQ